MKYCPNCQTEKPRSEFYKHANRVDGLQSNCKACKSARSASSFKNNPDVRKRQHACNMANRTKARRYTRLYKAARGCMFCDEKHPAALDLHHLDPSVKDSAVSQMLYNSIAKIDAEIQKCVVLCSNCHRKHHAGVTGYEIHT